MTMTPLRMFGLVTTIACVSLGSAHAATDIITKKSDGKRVNGDISAMTKAELTLKRSQGEEVIQANDIALIEWGTATADLKLAYSDENGGRFDSSIQRLAKAKADTKSPSPFLQGEFEYVLARVQGKQALSDSGKRDQAIQKLVGTQKAFPEHIRYYDSMLLLSQLQLLNQDYAGVRATAEILKKSPWNEMRLAALIAEARVEVSEGKLDEAIASFEAAAKAAGQSPAEVSRKYEAMLGQARGLLLKSKFDDALKLLDVVTDKGPLDDSAIQAEAYVLQGQALLGLGNNKEAALAFLHVDVLFSKESEFHAEALYQLSRVWKLVQHPERSADAAGKLVQNYPNSEWRKKLEGSDEKSSANPQ